MIRSGPGRMLVVALSLALFLATVGSAALLLAADPDLREPSASPPAARPSKPARSKRSRPSPPPVEEPDEPEAPEPTPSPAFTLRPPPSSASPTAPAAGDASIQFLSRAREALRSGRFVLPPGECAVDQARRAAGPGAAGVGCRLVEERARTSAESQARAAAARGDAAGAARIYQRLAALFPDRAEYASQAQAAKTPSPAGEWDWRVKVLITVRMRVVFDAGGTCRAMGLGGSSGTWVLADPAARRFVITWSSGATDTLTLSADGEHLDGRNNMGIHVSGTRIH